MKPFRSSLIASTSGFVLFVWCVVPVNGMPVRWEVQQGGNGHYYEVVHEPLEISWLDAKAAAEARQGYLATITSAAENQFVFDLTDEDNYWVINEFNYAIGPWLGGIQDPSATQVDEGWGWVTGEPWTYTNWNASPAEPNDGGNYVENHNEEIIFFFNSQPQRQSTWADIGVPSFSAAYVVEFVSVPEPSTVLLGTLASIGLMLRRRGLAR